MGCNLIVCRTTTSLGELGFNPTMNPSNLSTLDLDSVACSAGLLVLKM